MKKAAPPKPPMRTADALERVRDLMGGSASVVRVVVDSKIFRRLVVEFDDGRRVRFSVDDVAAAAEAGRLRAFLIERCREDRR